ncbi:mRNA splicing factor U2 associated factor (nucleomorph) [Lotharella oceanica]|uniref:mRNA splicing factor U2 associated factor n=1 Tax=Lotharella oceanica TaxID=641309 RepID=A0A060DGE1_9EUKA|nr:mRNA splicing factor U2 associated factor [Lotharella oceanica]|mmetsp:Transcript_34629/g.64142  ORF Transcript_34629/g.64142 Transcript_34629/m.64142 type:complete len:196 (-) Transcript_34629:3223-3810(-)
MAEQLASILGTEKDRVNCPFYFKIGACRHGAKCSRLHNKPSSSSTLIIINLYQNPALIAPIGIDGLPKPMDPYNLEKKFEEFYEDIFEEFAIFGQIENINICDNLSDHMIGNVYVKFRNEKSAMKALKSINGRFYNGRIIIAETSPVTDFREATCRQFQDNTCTRGGYCNFMHLKSIKRSLRKKMFDRYKNPDNI